MLIIDRQAYPTIRNWLNVSFLLEENQWRHTHSTG